LDLGSLGVGLLLRILGLNFPTDNKFSDIVLLCQIEKLANLARSLGAEAFGLSDVGNSGDLFIALFDNDNGKDSEIGTNDAASDGFAFSFSGTSGSVARVAFGEEETNTGGMEDTLKFESVVAHKRKNLSAGLYILHGEALFVVPASDFEDVAFEFVSNGVSSDFLANLHRMSILFEGKKVGITLLSINARSRRSSSISMSF
jgi:hypothetical protein